jgi:hypothetical protein
VGISRDYPLKTRTSKQPIGEILGIKIISSHPLKYPRSKQGLTVEKLTMLGSIVVDVVDKELDEDLNLIMFSLFFQGF